MTDKENKMRKCFSVRLLIAAETRGKRIGQIARAMNMSDRTVYGYCYGYLPKVTTLLGLCEYLDVSADYLLGRTDKMEVER